MTDLADPATDTDFTRDRWGRPLIVPETGGRPVPYTRSSSMAKTVEDTYNLELWARRNVAYGLAHDESLVARVLAVGGNPATWDQATRNTVNRIVEDAAAAAQAHKGADIGSAVHRLTERLDLGETVAAGPYQADLEAYTGALLAARLTVTHVECHIVCDALQAAGTADRIVRDAEGRHRILDLKTGATVDYGALGWGAQLAAYAHGSLYDPVAGVRLDTPPLDRAVGYICHLPAGLGECTIYDIDLVAGHRAAELANEIRAVRREAKRWITPLAVAAPEPTAGDLDAMLGRAADEGVELPAETFNYLQDRYGRLSPPSHRWFSDIVTEAKQAGVTFHARTERTERRFHLYDGLITLAEGGCADAEAVRALVALVTDSDAPLYLTVTIGHAVGSLGAEAAEAFADACADLVAGRLVADYGDPVGMRLRAP